MTHETIVGNYKIDKKIGFGTFGLVKQGIHSITGEKVAIKILEKSKIVNNDDKQRVNNEIKFLKKINHPNVIKLLEKLEDSQSIFLVMEYVGGGELFQHIVRKKRLNENEASFFFYQLVNGLDSIHKNNIVHRDLKPENLLFNEHKQLKIIDFGLSNNYYEGSSLLSTPCGSPCYAAPEMVLGKKYSGVKVDTWSIGIILFAMTAGYLPFEDKNNDKLFKKIVKCNLEFPSYVSDHCIQTINFILDKNPETRVSLKEIKEHSFYQLGKRLYNKHMKNRYEEIYENFKISFIENLGNPSINEEYYFQIRKQSENLVRNFVLEKMVKDLKFEQEEVLNNLEEQRHNTITTTFFLLVNKYIGNNYLLEVLFDKEEKKMIESRERFNKEKKLKEILDNEHKKEKVNRTISDNDNLNFHGTNEINKLITISNESDINKNKLTINQMKMKSNININLTQNKKETIDSNINTIEDKTEKSKEKLSLSNKLSNNISKNKLKQQNQAQTIIYVQAPYSDRRFENKETKIKKDEIKEITISSIINSINNSIKNKEGYSNKNTSKPKSNDTIKNTSTSNISFKYNSGITSNKINNIDNKNNLFTIDATSKLNNKDNSKINKLKLCINEIINSKKNSISPAKAQLSTNNRNSKTQITYKSDKIYLNKSEKNEELNPSNPVNLLKLNINKQQKAKFNNTSLRVSSFINSNNRTISNYDNIQSDTIFSETDKNKSTNQIKNDDSQYRMYKINNINSSSINNKNNNINLIKQTLNINSEKDKDRIKTINVIESPRSEIGQNINKNNNTNIKNDNLISDSNISSSINNNNIQNSNLNNLRFSHLNKNLFMSKPNFNGNNKNILNMKIYSKEKKEKANPINTTNSLNQYVNNNITNINNNILLINQAPINISKEKQHNPQSKDKMKTKNNSQSNQKNIAYITKFNDKSNRNNSNQVHQINMFNKSALTDSNSFTENNLFYILNPSLNQKEKVASKQNSKYSHENDKDNSSLIGSKYIMYKK